MVKTAVNIICYNRKNELRECIRSMLKQVKIPDEIVIVDNGSTDDTDESFELETRCYPLFKYFKLPTNLGVAGGRNYGIKQGSGDILVFIDDDALIEPENALETIAAKFEKDPQVGILAFKVVNYYTKTIRREEFPHVDKSLKSDREFETSYFIGAGHAIRREVFDKCGLYPEDYFYGMEELDLSFRAVDKGYKIIYFPEVVVWHKKSPFGRMGNEEKWIYSYRNRLAVSYKYLQTRHLVVLAFIWFLKIVKESRSLLTPLKGLAAFFEFKKSLVKQPVSDATIEKIKKLKGRIWY